jgi:hypothetical protein
MRGPESIRDNRAADARLGRASAVSRLHRRLLAYSAAAAGSVVYGPGDEAEAAIVYRDFPDVTVRPDTPPFELDLALDGIADFSFASPMNLNGLGRGHGLGPWNGTSCGCGVPSALRAYAGAATTGFIILPMNELVSREMGFVGEGPLASYGIGYLGLEFAIDSALHYGWVRVENLTGAGLSVYDAAYEDRAGVGIRTGLVPEPAPLGLLALGAVGLALWRQHGSKTARGAE